MPGHAGLGAPGQNGVRGELGAVVRDNHLGVAAPFDDTGQLARDANAGDRGVWDRAQAFPRHVIDDVEDAKAPAVRRRLLRLRMTRPSLR